MSDDHAPPGSPAPGPLEAYAIHFDALFSQANQRHAFRQYLEGLLLSAERNKTLTALANTEPIVGAQRPEAQALQWFLSESTWDPDVVNRRRIELLMADPVTAPTATGALVIDEHGDRKRGTHTAYVGQQYLANLGKVETGVVSVTSLWTDERVSYPLHCTPYTPAHHFAKGKKDPRVPHQVHDRAGVSGRGQGGAGAVSGSGGGQLLRGGRRRQVRVAGAGNLLRGHSGVVCHPGARFDHPPRVPRPPELNHKLSRNRRVFSLC